jgi:hypothetical protein
MSGRNDARTTRGQINTLEPIVIVIILVLIVGIGLGFYVRASADVNDRTREELRAEQDIVTLAALSRMPELSCTSDISRGTNCIDVEKAAALASHFSRDANRLPYYSLLGSSSVTLTWIDTASGGTRRLLLYNATGTGGVRATRTYFTVYDPRTGTRRFAVLDVRRST